jgi:hypothetical protein
MPQHPSPLAPPTASGLFDIKTMCLICDQMQAGTALLIDMSPGPKGDSLTLADGAGGGREERHGSWMLSLEEGGLREGLAATVGWTLCDGAQPTMHAHRVCAECLSIRQRPLHGCFCGARAVRGVEVSLSPGLPRRTAVTSVPKA